MIQIDMAMPKSCTDCPLLFLQLDFTQCRADGRYMYKEDAKWMSKQRPNWCPLKEINMKENSHD